MPQNRLADRVLVTTQTTGTGTYALGNAYSDGFFAPADISPSLNGARVSYVVVDSLSAPSVVEIGEGVLASGSPWTLTRAQIRQSKTGGVAGTSAINWPAGTRYLFIAALAANAVQLDTSGILYVPANALLTPQWGGTAAGTADARTISHTPPVTAWAGGLEGCFINGAAANATTTPTLSPDGLTAKTIVRADGSTIAAGDLPAGAMIAWRYNPTTDRVMLQGLPPDATQARASLSLGTLALQAASAVAITGGTINGAVIGGTTPASGTFTSVGITGGLSASAAVSGIHTPITVRNTDAGASAVVRMTLGNDVDPNDLRIELQGSGNSAGIGARAVNLVANGGPLQITNSGILYLPAAYTQTTATAANAAFDSLGQTRRSTSSLKYKTDVEPIDLETVRRIGPQLLAKGIWYRSNCPGDRPEWSWYGLPAEDVAAIDPRLAFHAQPTKTIEVVDLVEQPETVEVELEETIVSIKDGRAVLRTLTTRRELPVMDEFPLFDAAGAPVLDAEGAQVVHRVPRMRQVELRRQQLVEDLDKHPVPESVFYDRVALVLCIYLADQVQQLGAPAPTGG